MKLTIEIPCNHGVEMENNLNRCIADFSEALKKKGFSPMELIAHNLNDGVEPKPIYKLTLAALVETKAICSHCGDEIEMPLCKSCEMELTMPTTEY